MATQGAIPTFSETASVRGGSAIPAAFLAAGEAKYDEGSGGYSPAGSKKMQDVLTYAQYLDSKERQDWQQKHQLAQEQHQIEMDKRQQRRLDMELERKKRADDLAMHNEELENRAGALAASIYQLDPNRPDYMDKKREIFSDPLNHQALNSKFGARVMEDMKYQDARHNNMIDWWRSQSEQSGYQGSFYDAPRTQSGDIDFKASQELFNKAAQQKAVDLQSAQREQEYQMGQQGMVLKKSTYDPQTGQMTNQEYVPKAQTGFKELKAAEREVDDEFKRRFGVMPKAVLNYPVGTKDPRGYTLTSGRMDGKKFVEDPGGNVVNVHSAQHPKADVKIGLDDFSAFRDKYSKLSDARERIMSEYPALAKEQESTDVQPQKKSSESEQKMTEVQKQNLKTSAKKAISEIYDKTKRIDTLQKEIEYLSGRSGISDPSQAIAEKTDEIASLQEQIASLQAGLKEEGEFEVSQMRKTSPLSGGEGGTTKSGKPPISDFDK